MTCIKFGVDRLRGFWSAGCQISPLPIDFAGRPYNSAYATACTVIVHCLLDTAQKTRRSERVFPCDVLQWQLTNDS